MATYDPRRLVLAREAAGLSREELAEAVGRPVTVLAALEAGEVRPSLPMLAELTRALSCPVSALYSGRGEPDVRGRDSALASDLGSGVDAWVDAQAGSAPPMREDAARRISAALFVQGS